MQVLKSLSQVVALAASAADVLFCEVAAIDIFANPITADIKRLAVRTMDCVTQLPIVSAKAHGQIRTVPAGWITAHVMLSPLLQANKHNQSKADDRRLAVLDGVVLVPDNRAYFFV